MQIITVAGKLGRDAELRSAGNDQVCSFSVAVDQRNGRDKSTNWWRVSLWGKRGEALAQYLTKGASVTVSGEFSLTEYEGKPQLNIRASEIALQGGKSDGAPAGDGSRGAPSQTGRQANANAADIDDDMSDIPFASNEGVW